MNTVMGIVCSILVIALLVFVFLTFVLLRAFQTLSYFIKEQGYKITKEDVQRCMKATNAFKGLTDSK